MLKVLHLLSSDRFSGAENVVCQIITAFDGDSEVEHLYVSPEGPIRETLKEKNIRYVPVKYLNGIDLKRIVRIEQPDIIHAHDMLASLFATFCVRNIPIVSHIHNNNFGFKGVGPFVTSLAYCIAARRAKHIFWVSEAAYNGFRYKKICSSKSSVLYNVINIEELNNSIKIDPEKYQYDLIFLGRLTYAKNPQRVLEVTKILKNQKDDIKVAMVGAGELENELRNFVKDNQLEKNVDFWGFRKNPYKILKNSQVMIMTSRWEGLGMCALEAMALGVPVVSTPTGGLCEILEDGKNGFLRKSNKELADKIIDILNNPSLKEQMSTYASENSIKMNSREKYKNKILDVYKKVSGK